MSGTVSKSRPIRASDFDTLFNRRPPKTVFGVAWDDDDGVAAVAGYWLHRGTPVVFSDIRQGATAPAIRIWREALKFMEGLDRDAVCMAEDGSGPFLERLGWQHSGSCDEGEIYRWRISLQH